MDNRGSQFTRFLCSASIVSRVARAPGVLPGELLVQSVQATLPLGESSVSEERVFGGAVGSGGAQVPKPPPDAETSTSRR